MGEIKVKVTGKREIEEVLEKYHNFSECVIEQISWLHYGATVEVVLNYVWTSDGKIRPDLSRPDLVTLRFLLVQRMHIDNALNDSMCSEPEMINWGKNEVATVKLFSEDVFLKRYRFLPVRFYHMSFLWEGDPRIDIIFSELEVIRGDRGASEMS